MSVDSPSLWYDEQKFVKDAPAFLESHKDLKAALFMTMGNELFPKSTSARVDLAQVHAEMGDLPRAVEEVSTSLRMFPGNSYARGLLEHLTSKR